MSKSKNKNILNWLPLCIFISLLLISIFSFAYGYDYFWHVKSGEYIVNNLKIPYYDIFSWYGITNHLYWFSPEWLSEVVIYLFKYLFKEGAFVYCLVMLTLLITLLTYFLKDKISKNIYFSSGWALLGMLTLIKVLLPRPHMISFILLVITMHLLYDNFYNDSKKIYFLPLISLCWANFHGGSSNLTYILCLIFMIAGLFNFKFGKIEAQKLTKKQIKLSFPK